MASEATEPKPGIEAMISRLAEILAIGAIRGWLDSGEAREPGTVRGLADPSIGRALGLMHAEPER